MSLESIPTILNTLRATAHFLQRLHKKLRVSWGLSQNQQDPEQNRLSLPYLEVGRRQSGSNTAGFVWLCNRRRSHYLRNNLRGCRATSCGNFRWVIGWNVENVGVQRTPRVDREPATATTRAFFLKPVFLQGFEIKQEFWENTKPWARIN